jgi:hypothetical protein
MRPSGLPYPLPKDPRELEMALDKAYGKSKVPMDKRLEEVVAPVVSAPVVKVDQKLKDQAREDRNEAVSVNKLLKASP